MAGGIVGGMFCGPLGAQLGSQIGGGIGNMLEGLISQHGQPNVQSAMNNNMLGSLVSQLSQAIQFSPGTPQFAKDELCQALQDVQHSCPQEPTPPGCQQDTDNAMSGLIDKIVDKVVGQIMQKLQGGGGCENGGSIQDMVRQAIEDVVREQFGGGEDGGSCPANGDTATISGSSSAGGTDSSENTGSSNCSVQPTTEDDSEDGKKARSGNWLVALAHGMAKIAGDHLANMIQAQADMEASSGDTGKDGKKLTTEEQQTQGREFTEAQGRFQAESKLFSMVTEATSTAIKSEGDGLSSLARKQ